VITGVTVNVVFDYISAGMCAGDGFLWR